MAVAGFRQRDASGRVTWEVTDRLTRLYGFYSFDLVHTGTQNWDLAVFRGTVPIAGMANDGTWFTSSFRITGNTGQPINEGAFFGHVVFLHNGYLRADLAVDWTAAPAAYPVFHATINVMRA